MLTGQVPGGQSVQRNSYDVMRDGQRLLLNSNREVNDVRPMYQRPHRLATGASAISSSSASDWIGTAEQLGEPDVRAQIVVAAGRVRPRGRVQPRLLAQHLAHPKGL